MAQHTAKKSPLYTSKADAERKTEIVKRQGKDSDGAYRIGRREDSRRNG